MVQMVARVIAKSVPLTKRERLVMIEIGRDRIDTASAFVSYMSESYGFSKSSVWYNLKRLKDKDVLDFATKEEQGKPLTLTGRGLSLLRDFGRDEGAKLMAELESTAYDTQDAANRNLHGRAVIDPYAFISVR